MILTGMNLWFCWRFFFRWFPGFLPNKLMFLCRAFQTTMLFRIKFRKLQFGGRAFGTCRYLPTEMTFLSNLRATTSNYQLRFWIRKPRVSVECAQKSQNLIGNATAKFGGFEMGPPFGRTTLCIFRDTRGLLILINSNLRDPTWFNPNTCHHPL